MGFFQPSKHPSSNGEAFETVRQAMPGPAKDLAAEEMRRIMTEWHGGHCCKKTTGDSPGGAKVDEFAVKDVGVFFFEVV